MPVELDLHAVIMIECPHEKCLHLPMKPDLRPNVIARRMDGNCECRKSRLSGCTKFSEYAVVDWQSAAVAGLHILYGGTVDSDLDRHELAGKPDSRAATAETLCSSLTGRRSCFEDHVSERLSVERERPWAEDVVLIPSSNEQQREESMGVGPLFLAH